VGRGGRDVGVGGRPGAGRQRLDLLRPVERGRLRPRRELRRDQLDHRGRGRPLPADRLLADDAGRGGRGHVQRAAVEPPLGQLLERRLGAVGLGRGRLRQRCGDVGGHVLEPVRQLRRNGRRARLPLPLLERPGRLAAGDRHRGRLPRLQRDVERPRGWHRLGASPYRCDGVTGGKTRWQQPPARCPGSRENIIRSARTADTAVARGKRDNSTPRRALVCHGRVGRVFGRFTGAADLLAAAGREDANAPGSPGGRFLTPRPPPWAGEGTKPATRVHDAKQSLSASAIPSRSLGSRGKPTCSARHFPDG
jgi:hypothetical protein